MKKFTKSLVQQNIKQISSFWRMLRFPDDIESRYEADTASARSKDLQIAGLIALATSSLFLVNDWFTRPEVWPVALLWRVGVLGVYGLAVLALVRRGLPARWREAAMASTIVVAMLTACKIFEATTSEPATYDPFMFSLIFLVGNIVLRLPFVMAIASSLLSLVIAFIFLFSSTTLPTVAKHFVFVQLLTIVFFTWLICFWLERAQRDAYLLVLREMQRGEIATKAARDFSVLADTDALTQLPNRRAFDAELRRRWGATGIRNGSIAALLIDIDYFKKFNDNFGHQAGDECLRAIAKLMVSALRDDDFIARIGGEEFAVLCQPSSDFSVSQLAERLRKRVEDAGIPHDGLEGRIIVSISIGLAVTDSSTLTSSKELLASADIALYQAKAEGRNRFVIG